MEFIILIIAHLIGDFIFQPRWIGEGKSKSIKILLLHVLIYSLTTFTLPFIFIDSFSWVNFIYLYIGHFIVDIWTSKLTGYFYLKHLDNKNWKNKLGYNYMDFFWWVIGLDQTLHMVHLYLIYILL
jgi:hypothetical protein